MQNRFFGSYGGILESPIHAHMRGASTTESCQQKEKLFHDVPEGIYLSAASRRR